MEFPHDVLNSWPMTGPYPDEVIADLKRKRDDIEDTSFALVDLDDGRTIQVELRLGSDELIITEVERPGTTPAPG